MSNAGRQHSKVNVHDDPGRFAVEKNAELQQAVIRLGFAVLVGVFIYSVYYLDLLGGIAIQAVWCVSFYILLSAAHLIWNLISPPANRVRRFSSITLDMVCITWVMIAGEGLLAGAYGGYLWVSIANGLRFGKLYMKIAYVQSLIGFSLVMFYSDFWQSHMVISVGLLVWILLLPLYVYRLLTILENALIETEHANEAKSHFLANMSHEMRTPLTAILGFAEEGIVGDPSARGKALQIIKQSGDHMLRLINELLDFSKVEANELKVTNTECSLFEIIENIKGIFKRSAHDKQIELQVDYAFPLPESIVTDPLRLKQILINLIGNAIKFTDKGLVRVGVSYRQQHDSLMMTVADTGVGMSAEDLNTIFQPFKQVDASLSRRYEGTGLGLAISKKLAELLGGTLDVKSQLGVGTEFTLELKNIHAEGNLISTLPKLQTITETREQENKTASLYGEVLVAEDNEMNQRLLIAMLGRLGMSLTIVGDGESAVREAMNHHYDLIFMDMQMPELSGVEAVKRLRGMGYERPIVALTANALSESREACLQAGFDDFLTKPIVRSTLYEVCTRYLRSESTNKHRIISTILEQEPELADLVYNFVRRLPVTLDSIKEMLSLHSWQALAAKVHDLKGLGGAFGYPDITQIAVELEQQLKSGNTDNLPPLVERLEDIITRVVDGIDDDTPGSAQSL